MKNLNQFILERLKLNKDTKLKRNDVIDLGLPSGTLWATANVGATNGSTPESWYGNYFMWGDTEPADNKDCDWDNYKYANGDYDKLTKYCPTKKTDYWDGTGNPDNRLELDIEDEMTNANVGDNWYMPSEKQIHELVNNTTSEWVKDYKDISGLNGRLFTSDNGNTLFFPATGYRDSSSIKDTGSFVTIWSSTIDTFNPSNARHFFSNSYYNGVNTFCRCFGSSIRAVLK